MQEKHQLPEADLPRVQKIALQRLIPEWKDLQTKIAKKLKAAQSSAIAKLEKYSLPITLTDKPGIIYKVNRHPNRLETLVFYSANTYNYFVSFDWGKGTSVQNRKIKVWIQSNFDVNTIDQKEYPLETKARIKLLCYCTGRHVLITYCDDRHLRVFGDHSQGINPHGSVKCPDSVTCMTYNKNTGQLVTGLVGSVIFWNINYGVSIPLSISKVIKLNFGDLVNYIMFEPKASWMVVLCRRQIRIYNYEQNIIIKSLWNTTGVSLTCGTLHWLQRYLYAGDEKGHMHIWSFDTSSPVYEFKAHHGTITSMVIRLSVQTLFTASMDHIVKEWSLSNLELLTSISLDDEVIHFQMINENSFYCHTTHTFSIWSLNTFYKLFNATGSSVEKMCWVKCSANRSRVIAFTEDGMIRFISPITGELLLLTWPYALLEKATDYVYDPDLDELFIAVGSADILVLNTAMCPSPAKYIVSTSENKEDKALCLVSIRQKLREKMVQLIFSGHLSGQIKLIYPRNCSMSEQKIHDGSILAMCSQSMEVLEDDSMESKLLCSFGTDSYISLQTIFVKKMRIKMKRLSKFLSNCPLSHIRLIPQLVCAITEKNKIRFWHINESLWTIGYMEQSFTESEEIQTSTIISFDFCPSLGLLLTGEEDGAIRIWDTKGILQAEFGINQGFSCTCFANQRGDLLIGLNRNIYLVSSLQYLPEELLQTLASKDDEEELTEQSLPFIHSSLSSFDVLLVPKFLYSTETSKRYHTKRSMSTMEGLSVQDASMASEYKITPVIKSELEFFEVKRPMKTEQDTEFPSETTKMTILHLKRARLPYHTESQGQLHPLPDWEVPRKKKPKIEATSSTKATLCRKWPIAPDGYVPNSVIRALMWPGATPDDLMPQMFRFRVTKLPETKLVDTKLPPQLKKDRFWSLLKPEGIDIQISETLPQPDLFEVHDLLHNIANSAWLGTKLGEINLYTVLEAILQHMSTAPVSTYKLGTKALIQIFNAYTIPLDLKAEVAERLYEDTSDKQDLKRMEVWKTLVWLNLMDPKVLNNLTRGLMDRNAILRDQARSILASNFQVTAKSALTKLLKGNAITLSVMEVPVTLDAEESDSIEMGNSVSATDQLCLEVEERLTEDLHLLPPGYKKPTPEIKKKEKAKDTVKKSETWMHVRAVSRVKPRAMLHTFKPGPTTTSDVSDKMPPEEITELQAKLSPIPRIVSEVQPSETEVKLPEKGTDKQKSATRRERPPRIRPLLKRRALKGPGPTDVAKKESTLSVVSKQVQPEPKRSEDAMLKGTVGIHKPAAEVGSETVPLISTSVTEPFKTSLSTTVKGKEGDLKKADRFPIDPNKQYQTDYVQWKKSLHELISLPEVKASTAAVITGEQGGKFKTTPTGAISTGDQDGISGLPSLRGVITGEQDGISGLPSLRGVITGEQDGISGLPSLRGVITGEQVGISGLPSLRGVITGEQDGISGLPSLRGVITGEQDGISGLPSLRGVITGKQDGISGLPSVRGVITGEEDGISGLTSLRGVITGEQDGISGLTSLKDFITAERSGIRGTTTPRAIITGQQVGTADITPSGAIITGEQVGTADTTPPGTIITGEQVGTADTTPPGAIITCEQVGTADSTPPGEIITGGQDITSGMTFPRPTLSLVEGSTRSIMGKQGSLMEAPVTVSEPTSSEATIILLEQATSEDSKKADIHLGIHKSLQKVALFLPDEHLASLWSDFETMEHHLQMLRELITGSSACRTLKLPQLLKLSGTKKEAALKKIFCKVEKGKATLESKKATSRKAKRTDDFHIRAGRKSRMTLEEALDSPKPTGKLPPLVSRAGGDHYPLKKEGLLFTGQGGGLKSALTLSRRVRMDPCGAPDVLQPPAEVPLDSDSSQTISPEDMTWERFQSIIPFLTKIEPLYRKDRKEWQSILAWLRIQRQLQSPLSRMRADDPILRRQPLDILSKEKEVTSASLGQRVLRRMLIGGSKGQSTGSFHHIIPLSWQNNVHTLYPTGESIFGALELDWITIRHPVFMQSPLKKYLCH
ncbi:WD repeat-containing protein 87 [Lissotriton helveticus]